MADDFTTWCASAPIEDQASWRLQVAKFGDGYEQRARDGINALELNFAVAYDMRPRADIQAMDAYLRANGADAFNFKHPASKVIYQVFCDAWSISWQAPGFKRGSLHATFRKANGAAVQ